MTAKSLMFQGTGSDVGKSMVVAGLCRALVNRGLTVRPFKPQNMSNNAAVTDDGGEIGRAQALQAIACRAKSSVHMNPVLLKPQSEAGSQIVLQGQVFGQANARSYHELKDKLLPKVIESFDKLKNGSEFVLVEGAGSPAEINLRNGDIANMGFAGAANVPVVLVADIERGGAIASLVGTHAVLNDRERNLVAGYIINKFRGDISLFDSGITAIGERTGMHHFGTIPYMSEAKLLPAEDSVSISSETGHSLSAEAVRIAVLRLPRISNFDDFDPLIAEPGVQLTFVQPGSPIPADAKLVIIPGTKSTLADLATLRQEGWDIDIAAHVRRGGSVLGICGGYQMLGKSVSDPMQLEGGPNFSEGLGHLNVETVIEEKKRLREISATSTIFDAEITGYEIHMGQTEGPDCQHSFAEIDGKPDGAVSANGQTMGCYIHGLFSADEFRHNFLKTLGGTGSRLFKYQQSVDAALDDIARTLEANLDIDALIETAI